MVALPVSKLNDPAGTVELISRIRPTHLICIGNFWDNCSYLLGSKLKEYGGAKFNIYSFGNHDLSPTEFILSLANREDYVLPENKKLALKLIDDRVKNRDIEITQAFYAGVISHYLKDKSTILERFEKFFSDDTMSTEAIIAIGNIILPVQEELARSMTRNSRVMEFRGISLVGTQMGCGPHLARRRKCPY